jgi:hypothetical protein
MVRKNMDITYRLTLQSVHMKAINQVMSEATSVHSRAHDPRSRCGVEIDVIGLLFIVSIYK